MASSSQNTFEESLDDTFDQFFYQHFDQAFENFSFIMVSKKNKGEEGKNEFISKETVKKAMSVYGMIISVKLQHILKIYSGDDFE